MYGDNFHQHKICKGKSPPFSQVSVDMRRTIWNPHDNIEIALNWVWRHYTSSPLPRGFLIKIPIIY